ncbi:hypothetical protein AAG607_12060 [Citromicrobium bathyomarinum]|uniref:hypothetical protein n=1 Tax=Citromicrobium bathyomarinum TaxID=72174 RepID=UPI00315A8F69
MLVLDMPEGGVAQQEFEPEEFDAIAPERGGRLGGIMLGEPLWRARFELGRSLTRDASDDWRAFIARLRRSQRPFLAYDHDRIFPRAYPRGFSRMTRPDGSPFDGSAASWSAQATSDFDELVTLTQLPGNLLLGKGDYIGFKWDAEGSNAGTYDRRAMVRVVEPARANAAGEITVMVEMPVPTRVVPETAIAHLDKPCCLMRRTGGSLGMLDRRQKIAGGTLEALQDLRP